MHILNRHSTIAYIYVFLLINTFVCSKIMFFRSMKDLKLLVDLLYINCCIMLNICSRIINYKSVVKLNCSCSYMDWMQIDR